MRRIVLTGATGLLGRRLLATLAASGEYEIHSVGRSTPPPPDSSDYTHHRVALDNPQEAVERLTSLKPYAIIHAAGPSNFATCEADAEGLGAATLGMARSCAQAARLARAKIVLLSCDRVFDGGVGPFDESAPRNPASAWGRMLAEAEGVVEELCDDRLILRTSGLFGWEPARPSALPQPWAEVWHKNHQVGAPGDIMVSATFADVLPAHVFSLLKQDGIFHLAGERRLSLADLAGALAWSLEVPASKVGGYLAAQHPQMWGPPFEGGLIVDRYASSAAHRWPSLDVCLKEIGTQARRADWLYTA